MRGKKHQAQCIVRREDKENREVWLGWKDSWALTGSGQRRLSTMGDAANKENASELQVLEQSAEGWQEAGKSSPSCCCSMAEGRGRSLALLFHSLTKKEIISVTAEA